MSGSRMFSAATVGARVLIGAAAATGTVVLVAVAIAAPWTPVVTAPLSIEARPAAADVTLACAGGILIGGRNSSDASVIDVAAAAATTAGAPDGLAPAQTEIASPDVQGTLGALAFTEAPQGDEQAELAAAQLSRVSADDVRGLAANGCAAPLSESWLVGGATTTGWSAFVQLSNPSAVAATATLTVFTESGATPAGASVVVPPRSQRVLPLAGLAVAAENPVVRVTAEGAPVTATLQSNRIRTITPSGVDVQSAIALPDLQQVIAGVVVPARRTAAQTDAVTTVVRVLAPSSDGTAVVTVTATDAAASAIGPITVPLTAGVPVDVDLPGLEAGSYTVRVESGVPVVSAAWQATQPGAGGDYAWHAASPVLDAPSAFAVPAGASATLHVVNESGAPATVTATTSNGVQLEIAVPAGGAGSIVLPRSGVYAIDAGDAPVRAALSLKSSAGIAAYPVWSSLAVGDAVKVYP